MKKLTIALLAIAAVAGQAQIKQTWSQALPDPNAEYWGQGVAVGINGNVFTLSMADGSKTRLTCHDGMGASLWTKNLTTFDTDEAGLLLADGQGNLFLQFMTSDGLAHIAKVDGVNGNILWDKSFEASHIRGMALDGQENIIIYGQCGIGFSGPAVFKFSRDGVLLKERLATAENAGSEPSRLAVSANGQIYVLSLKMVNGVSNQVIEALTPNLVQRYRTMWADPDNGNPTSIASDRNGRVCTAEVNSTTSRLVLRTFNSTGTATTHEFAVPGRFVYNLDPKFDANGRLVVGACGYEGTTFYVDAQWFTVTDTTATAVQRAKADVGSVDAPTVKQVVCDEFGQAYVNASIGGATYKNKLFAFDENRTSQIWAFEDTFAPRTSTFNHHHLAVGRWGQVGVTTTYNAPGLELGVSNIKQLGLRNLLINGQSFTGGRTITGTVNFYSSDTSVRTVNLTSNTSYAVVTPSASVAVGASQAGMSIELKATSVRRAVRIEGTFGGAKRSAVFYIEPPVASGLTLYPTTVKGGANVNGSARINGAAPAGGMVVNISSSDAAAVVPNSVTVAEGAVTKAFTVNTNVVSQQKTVTLTATTGSTSKTATLVVTP